MKINEYIRFYKKSCTTFWAVILLISLALLPASAEIIGDGDPENGIEDDRIPLSAVPTEFVTQLRSVGVIRCDGQVQGLATLVSVQENTAIALTAAHVLAGKDDCLFYPYNMYEGFTIQPLTVGPYAPGQKTATTIRYEGDYAIFSLRGDLKAYGSAPLSRSKQPVRKESPLLHVGYSPKIQAMTASLSACFSVTKEKQGLAAMQPSIGLDSCDSQAGASGGPVFQVSEEGQLSLLGLRTGYLFMPASAQDKPQKGDKADTMRFANAHHVITKAIRAQIKSQTIQKP